MGKNTGFLEIDREEGGYRPVEERLSDYNEVEVQLSEDKRQLQAARCMDCGVPFCHWACPVSNLIPEWQDAVYRGNWQKAYDILSSTNDFPEITGRVCPALCEASCVLGIHVDPVTCRQNELSIVEKAFIEGYIKVNPPKVRTGKKVAVIGSGPAGLAAANQLNRAGHSVVLYEADQRVGGYLRYGIPDFKLEKKVIDRRVEIMKAEGIEIRTGVCVGTDISVNTLQKEYEAICLTIGAREPRNLNVPGRDLKGIHFALDYLTQQNCIVSGEKIPNGDLIKALNKNVVVIGGGDTGSDCVGTANRQGALKIHQLELLPQPPAHRDETMPWPLWPKVMKTSSSHLEGCERMWNIATKEFLGEKGIVKRVKAAKVEWTLTGGKWEMKEIPNSEFEIAADLVLLAMGFVCPVKKGLVEELGVELDGRGNIKTNENFETSVKGIYAAGDAHRGAALVVWAIHEGRKAAAAINTYLA